MIYHILNGDALYDRFVAAALNGKIVVDRECLIDGDLFGDTLTAFWQTRAAYIQATYGGERSDYYDKVVQEFEKIIDAPGDAEINLWFGYDLFCQANLWFILSLLHQKSTTQNVYVVYPTYLKEEAIWNDFGGATPEDLIACFANRAKLDEADVNLGKNLWTAYKANDLVKLKTLSEIKSPSFPYLKTVCEAHTDRFAFNGKKSRPEAAVAEIIQNVSKDFSVVFHEFFKRQGVYGFGDVQVKKIYDDVMQHQ